MEPDFHVGQVVYLKADPNRQGPIIEVLSPVGGRYRYRVFHTLTEVREYYAEQLCSFMSITSAGSEAGAIFDFSPLPTDEFRARLIAVRLAHHLTDNLYALHAARIKFIPFQFKPLLRLLRADRPRLLIADEVGVGKTIEAGLILKELQARQRLENVLIVCPKALVTKWRVEMRRFDEDFQPLTADTLRYCLRETQYDGAWPAQYARAIIHLELFRNQDYLLGTTGHNPRPGLTTLDPPPQFSLAIFDEAHHLRNPETSSHQLARFICDNAEAVLFLSATPMQLRSKNLYTLLNLLRPDLFLDETVFNEMVVPNRYLNQAIRHVRSRKPEASWPADAQQALVRAAMTSWGVQTFITDPRFSEWLQKLNGPDSLMDAARIRCLRDLEEMHSLAHVMNRTRRRDIGRFTIREPRTIRVPFTPAQEAFYHELIHFRRQVLALRHNSLVIHLIIDTLERQVASCLPALLPTLDSFLQTGRFSTAMLSDATDEDEDKEFTLPEPLRQQAAELRRLASQLPPDDPKLEALLKIACTTRDTQDAGKLLVFSFFLHTLNYLAYKLQVSGFRVGVVTGKVEEDDREHLRSRFRKPATDPDAIDILLSSEVGCEGLDYEFCDRMVNYDIPWNPMRLEQRIGRIDRFGQNADKVLIFNFVTPGTVEERIFFRCFERLGIFRDTIGDCEEVLGEQAVTEQLLELARNPHLTPEQAEEKAQQIAANAIRFVDEQRRLEQEGETLLGLDQGLIDEVNAIGTEGRFVTPYELTAMIAFLVEQPALGGKLEADRETPGLHRLRLNREARSTLARQLRDLHLIDRSAGEFRRWLEGSEPQLLLTFDQQTALERRDLPFITPVHPLARLSTAALKPLQKPLSTHLKVQNSAISAGTYLFACDLWETVAITPEIRLVNLAWSLEERCLAPELANQLLRLLAQAENVTATADLSDAALREALNALDEQTQREHDSALGELRTRNELLVRRRLTSLETYHQNRLTRVQAEITASSNERITRMKTSEYARIKHDYEAKRQEIEHRRNADIVRERIAVGILEVTHA